MKTIILTILLLGEITSVTSQTKTKPTTFWWVRTPTDRKKQVYLTGKKKGVITIDLSNLSNDTYQYTLYIDNKLINTQQMARLK